MQLQGKQKVNKYFSFMLRQTSVPPATSHCALFLRAKKWICRAEVKTSESLTCIASPYVS